MEEDQKRLRAVIRQERPWCCCRQDNLMPLLVLNLILKQATADHFQAVMAYQDNSNHGAAAFAPDRRVTLSGKTDILSYKSHRGQALAGRTLAMTRCERLILDASPIRPRDVIT